MNPLREHELLINRRHFFGRTAAGIGAAALGSVLNPNLFSAFGAEPDAGRLPSRHPAVLHLAAL